MNLLSIGMTALPLLVGTGIGIAIGNDPRGPKGKWYKEELKKPSWNPPGWLFGPVWSLLYTGMGYASWRVLAAGAGPLPLALYAGQLALNFCWSPLFFIKHDLPAASINITALWGMVAATAYQFHKVDPLAGKLMLPYLGWVSFAAALTYTLTSMNSSKDDKPATKEL